MTSLYSILHFLVDGVCAWAMLGRFAGDYTGILIYNFCAFALQFPLGAVLDQVGGRKMPLAFAAAGCGLTLLGAVTGPAVLGLGNAAFHVGGGVDVIRADCQRGLRGQALGIFVAPGAMGLYLGTLLARGGVGFVLLPAAVLMAVLLLPIRSPGEISTAPSQKLPIPLALSCFAVVVLRSHVGMAVVFPWKTGFLAFAAVSAVVLGKMAGGVLAARFGAGWVTVLSLTIAAAGFALGSIPAFGLLALLCFNMTMPLTLYALWRRFPEYPGACFGCLTLALFLGFLPTYFGIDLPIGGVLGSILSLLLLWKAVDDA
ncbi:MAG: MFS transporter [Ruminococcaceae bacterium]|nr:MFS transporter [Oscillospiraceae bacterium]